MPITAQVRVRRTLAKVLPKGLRVEVTPSHRAPEPTFLVEVIAGEMTHRFVAGWAGEGWPGDVERLMALANLDVITARRMSEGARTALSERGVGWADETGRADISLPSGLVVIRDTPLEPSVRESSARWTASMLAVAEATLSGAEPTVMSVEEATRLSRNGTALALDRLERLGLLERPHALRGRASGRRVVDRDALLEAYASAAAEARAKQQVVKVHTLWNDPLDGLIGEAGPRLAKTKHTWAVTGAAAGQLLAPYLTTLTVVDLYVDADLFADRSRLAELVGGRVVDRGHRLEIRELPTAISAAGPVVNGVRLALPVRVYADLVAAGGRSADAAQHLKETLNVGTAA